MNIDGAADILVAMISLAVDDLNRGSGTSCEQQRNYRTAADWLDRAGILERVCETHGLDYAAAVDSVLEHETRPNAPKVMRLKRRDQPTQIVEQRAMLLAA